MKHLGWYLKPTVELGLLFSSRHNDPLEGCIYFLLDGVDDLSNGRTASSLVSFCDANWGPQDASIPDRTKPLRQISQEETRSICGHVLTKGARPILWKVHKERKWTHFGKSQNTTIT